MSLQAFLESMAGQITVVAVILLLFIGILISGKGQKMNTKALVVSAIFVALSVVLNQFTAFRMLQGGSATAFSMLPIVLCAYYLGVRRGVMAGMCVGLLTLIFNPFVIHPAQLILDYPLAFGALGFAGILRNKKYGMVSGYALGVISRYICAVLSGVIFFGSYAPAGSNVLIYSLGYNLTYLGIEGLITLLLLAVPQVRHVFERLRTQF